MDPDNFFLFDHAVGADGSRPVLLEQPSREGLYNVLFNSKLASNLSCSHLEHPLKSGDESWIRAGYSAIDYCAKFETDEVSLKDL